MIGLVGRAAVLQPDIAVVGVGMGEHGGIGGGDHRVGAGGDRGVADAGQRLAAGIEPVQHGRAGRLLRTRGAEDLGGDLGVGQSERGEIGIHLAQPVPGGAPIRRAESDNGRDVRAAAFAQVLPDHGAAGGMTDQGQARSAGAFAHGAHHVGEFIGHVLDRGHTPDRPAGQRRTHRADTDRGARVPADRVDQGGSLTQIRREHTVPVGMQGRCQHTETAGDVGAGAVYQQHRLPTRREHAAGIVGTGQWRKKYLRRPGGSESDRRECDGRHYDSEAGCPSDQRSQGRFSDPHVISPAPEPASARNPSTRPANSPRNGCRRAGNCRSPEFRDRSAGPAYCASSNSSRPR